MFIAYAIGLVIACAYNVVAGLKGKDAAIVWILFIAALEFYIILILARRVRAQYTINAPGFQKEYEILRANNMELTKENTEMRAELEWRRSTSIADASGKRPEQPRLEQLEHNDKGQFLPRTSQKMSTKEKQIRAYLKLQNGMPLDEIARSLGMTTEASVKTYVSHGKKLVEKNADLLKGIPASEDEIVEFLCGNAA